MRKEFKHLTQGRHVFYQHEHYGTLAAIVTKVEKEAGEPTGVINLCAFLLSGVPLPITSVPYAGDDVVETYVNGKWRWMFHGQMVTSTAGAVPTALVSSEGAGQLRDTGGGSAPA